MGILFALGALISWGVGDFLIQRSARRFGDDAALFFITGIGAVALLPLVWNDIPVMLGSSRGSLILWASGLVLLGASLLDFEALRIGKLSVVEPVYAFEIAIAASLSTWFLNEHLTLLQVILIAALIAGIFLVSIRRLLSAGRLKIERGVLIAVAAMVLMGTATFLFGLGSRETSPLMINWFTAAFVFVVLAGYLTGSGNWNRISRLWTNEKPLILSVGLIDNMAWIFFSYSTLSMPVAIATGISESYVALAALLGLWLNHEKLLAHQFIGLVVTVGAAVALAMTVR